jgi:cell division protein FtsQ
MSRGGRRRLAGAALRASAAVVMAIGLAWGAWAVLATLLGHAQIMPATARVPVRQLELKTNPEGVLDRDPDWLMRTLALPKGVSLMELDLQALREKLLADGQVLTANLMLKIPDRLVVQVTERMPVARVMAEWSGAQRQLFVARDGVVFAGTGYDPAMVATLPWLDGVALTRKGGAFQPLAGMEAVGALLATAQNFAVHLYDSWGVISLARLDSDREIEVHTREPQGVTIVFNANDDYFRQLARLNYMWDKLTSQPLARARVDLSLGRQVPVLVEEAPAAGKPARTEDPAFMSASARPGLLPLFSPPRSPQPKNKREF